jgi:hypothetical protein
VPGCEEVEGWDQTPECGPLPAPRPLPLGASLSGQWLSGLLGCLAVIGAAQNAGLPCHSSNTAASLPRLCPSASSRGPGPPVHHTSYPCQLSQYYYCIVLLLNNCSTFNGPVAAGTAGTADWGLVRQSDDHPLSLCLLSMGSLPERTSPRIPASWGWSLAGFCQLVKFGQVWTRAT